jgi:hypothetical protein
MAAELETHSMPSERLRVINLDATFRKSDSRAALHEQLRRGDTTSCRTNDDDVLPDNRESQSRSLWDGRTPPRHIQLSPDPGL